VGNLLMENIGHQGPDDWPLPAASLNAAASVDAGPALAYLPAAIERARKPGETVSAASA